MSEVRLVVREAACDWSGTIHGSCAERAIAALSADPVTLEELEAASARYAKRTSHPFFVNLRKYLDDAPYDAGLVVIDLTARLIVVDSTYCSPGRNGRVYYHSGECGTDISLRYHLAEDWEFSSDGNQWPQLAEERRRVRLNRPDLDFRAVLYGRRMVEHIARGAFAAFARRDQISADVRSKWRDRTRKRLAEEADLLLDQVDSNELTDEKIALQTAPGQEHYASLFYDTLSQIHADWLLTPRKDLGGECPRTVALQRHDQISADLDDQCHHWSRLDVCPPGLSESSHAFRFSGFGSHEWVEYYELVRHLLWSCWDKLTELSQHPKAGLRPESLMVGDFLTEEVPRLEMRREDWLDAEDEEFHGRTPRSIINRERARLPEGVSGHSAMVDPDCPCCQMLADMPGPTFWHLDGCNLDNEFAFSADYFRREEWEEEQRGWEEMSRRFDATWSEKRRLGVTNPTPGEDGSNALWSRSFSLGETVDVPLGMRVFGLGGNLAELIVDLRAGATREATPVTTQRHIDQLNRHFGNLREVLQSADATLADAIFSPVVASFVESLSTVASEFPTVAAKCEALASELRKLPEPPPPERKWEGGDFEIPF